MASELFRIAAIGDLHLAGNDSSELQWVRALLVKAAAHANVVVLCGDLTCHGTPAELRPLLETIQDLDIPIVAVLGNHDHESDRADELQDLLEEEGVAVLDGSAVEIDGVGFAGVKGAGGGFGRHTVKSFGEHAIKSFMEDTQREIDKLQVALDALASPVKVVLMHYAPVEGTLDGEPHEIWPFLGHSGFWNPIRAAGASVVFHGHAHFGSVLATRENIPVFNVARPVLRRHNLDVRIWSKRRPEMRALA